MDITSLIEIGVVIVVAYILIRFVVSPALKSVAGILIILVFIYVLQQFFGFSLDQILAPFGISFSADHITPLFNPFLNFLNQGIDSIKNFFGFLLQNLPKTPSK